MPHYLDTTMLLYSISPAPAETSKRDRALELLDNDDGALSVQVLQEFYVQSTRTTRPGRLTHDRAVDLMDTWRRFPVQEMTLAVFDRALQIKASHQLAHWDSAIVAAAQALGCDTLYAEDMGDRRDIASVRIINPFR